MPDPAFGAASASDGTYFYVFSGTSTAGSDVATLRRFDPRTNVWTTLAPMPSPAEQAAAVYSPWSRKIYVLGGLGINPPSNVFDLTRIYDIANDTWSLGAPLPAARAAMAAGFHNGQIYVAGGYATNQLTSGQTSLWRYDPVAGTWDTTLPAMSTGVGEPASGMFKGTLFVAGGRAAPSGAVTDNVIGFDVSTSMWRPWGHMPIAQAAMGSGTVGDRLWVFGGQLAGGNNHMFIFDPVRYIWIEGQPLHVGRAWVSGAAVGQKLFAAGGSNLTAPLPTTEMMTLDALADHSADCTTDWAILRPEGGAWTWYTLNQTGFKAQQFGLSSDRFLSADYDGDSRSDLAVWRENTGTFYALRSTDRSLLTQPFGATGDNPLVPADYDGDGKADVTVWRPSNGIWYIWLSGSAQLGQQPWGQSGDSPAAGDYDGDGRADFAVRRDGGSGQATYHLLRTTAGYAALPWGLMSDSLRRGDYDGDGKTDLAVSRDSGGTKYWYIQRSSDGSFMGMAFGAASDVPVSGDYDADGKTDIAVWRPSEGVFYVWKSSTSSLAAQQFGQLGDSPLANFFIY